MLHIRNHRLFSGALFGAIFVGLFVIFSSFHAQGQRTKKPGADIPATQDSTRQKPAVPGNSYPMYTEVQAAVDKAMKEMATELERINKAEMPNITAEINLALKEVNKAMGAVNLEHLQKEMERAIRETDFASLEREIRRNISDEELARAKAEMAKAFHEIDLAKWKTTLQQQNGLNKQALERDMQQLREDLQHSKAEMKVAMDDARKQMEEAKQQLQQLKTGLKELEKDGLIKKGDTIDIDWENETLIINGNRQPKEISDKYRKYFPDGKTMYHNKKPGII